MTRYDKYKNSQIDLIGIIPERWNIVRVKRICAMGRGRVISNEEIFDNAGEYPVYSSQTENDGIMGYLNSNDFEGEYVTWTTDGANAGTVSYRSGKFNCTNVCGTLLSNNKKILPKYLPYILNLITKYHVREDINPKLMNNMMGQIEICLPSTEEQINIIVYLDFITQKIDKLISNKKEQIEKLKELRHIEINNAVTKGINSNIKLKESNVEWLGKIPEHWEVKRLKNYTTKIGSGVTPKGGSEVYEESGIPLFRSQNIHFDGLRYDDIAFISEEIHNLMGGSKVQKNDVLLNITGASIGRCYYYDGSLGEANVNQHVCIIRPTSNLLSEFLNYFLSSESGQKQIFIGQVGTSREGLTFQDIKILVFALPPVNEQIEIVDYLKKKIGKIDLVQKTIEEQINKLQELRKIIIYNAVTGKIKVTANERTT